MKDNFMSLLPPLLYTNNPNMVKYSLIVFMKCHNQCYFFAKFVNQSDCIFKSVDSKKTNTFEWLL